MIDRLDWQFPLPRTHTGMLQANATMGIMTWGKGSTLSITIGRADLWDHRGGMQWTDSQNYHDIRRCLEANDEPGLQALFVTDTETEEGQPDRPSVIPVGCIDLGLGEDAVLQTGSLNMKTGDVEVIYTQGGNSRSLTMTLSMDAHVLAIQFGDGDEARVSDRPSWDTLGDTLGNISFSPPRRLADDAIGGWVQDLPADPGIAVLRKWSGDTLWIVTARGENEDAALDAGRALLDEWSARGIGELRESNDGWWKDYWSDVPALELPNESLEALYAYGMYKFAGFSQPGGTAGTLQGPWIEEYRMPPWSSDYHFNINVQMCYWPAFKGNRLAHLMPLFELIFSWKDTLRENARLFIGIDDGYMLPHAVDDRCTCMGSFWTGCIDHGCTAWVAQMMYDYSTYSGDTEFLRAKAYPFMKGAMRVYEAMLERDGDRFVLPVSVSPEYRGDRMDAWGANASFQLACVHRLAENLQAAAATLDESPNPNWQDIRDGLPKACIVGAGDQASIGLWEDLDLEQSHRHHSHLAAICPFDTIDIEGEDWATIVQQSIRQWVWKGMGEWSGWCVPWASMLQSRLGNGDIAELLLTIWESVYTNEGRGTLHDCGYPGFTVMGAGKAYLKSGICIEIMQLDAGFGAVVAIQDMLLHSRRGVHHVFRGVPKSWSDCSFDGMLTEGGFLVSAGRKEGRTENVTIRAQRDGVIRIANPWDGSVTANSTTSGERRLEGETLDLDLKAGEDITLHAVE